MCIRDSHCHAVIFVGGDNGSAFGRAAFTLPQQDAVLLGAYKHVPLMEENPCEAVLVNVVGSRNVADKCIEYDVEKMVMVSTCLLYTSTSCRDELDVQ